MSGYLPDVEVLVPQALTDGVAHGTKVPADVSGSLPFRAIYKIGGAAKHPKFLGASLVHIVTLASTREQAVDLAEQARRDLYDAWRAQTRFGAGVIHKAIEVLEPFEPRTGTEPDGVFRIDQTHQVWSRP